MAQQTVTKDVTARTIVIERSFAAPRTKVWRAWTTSELLDRWWGPRDWPTTTKAFEFREGGTWHYKMSGPDGTQGWGLLEYTEIHPEDYFVAQDAFTDETGVVNADLPKLEWRVEFTELGDQTKLRSTLVFSTVADMQKVIEMGFEGGMTEQLDKLDEFLAA